MIEIFATLPVSTKFLVMFIKLVAGSIDSATIINQAHCRRSASSANPFDEGRRGGRRPSHRGNEEGLINETVVEGQGTRRQLAG